MRDMVYAFLACALQSRLSPIVRSYDDVRGAPYTVGWDARSLRLDGRPTLLLSGSIHYMRSTPEEWPGLFAEARANGLNTIESYVFWNAHAKGGPPPASAAAAAPYYDYTGSANVTRFLELAAEHNLFVIWRFGPYVCAEWPNGGLPAWLRQVPGLKERQYNAEWIAAVERWGRDHTAVIAPFLAENGGPIIASQIENEYGGNDMAYFGWMANFTQQLIPSIAWLMCGHVAHVANGTLHSGNGCPGSLPVGQHTVPGAVGTPALYTEDEQWFDYWGQPNIARDPRAVAYGVGSCAIPFSIPRSAAPAPAPLSLLLRCVFPPTPPSDPIPCATLITTHFSHHHSLLSSPLTPHITTLLTTTLLTTTSHTTTLLTTTPL